jgi:hypothetical protein
VPRPSHDEKIKDDYQKVANQLRIEIIKKTYGANSAGKDFIDFAEFMDMFHYQISAIMSKPNTI